MEPLKAFILLAKPHAVIQWFVLFETDRKINFLYLVKREKDID